MEGKMIARLQDTTGESTTCSEPRCGRRTFREDLSKDLNAGADSQRMKRTGQIEKEVEIILTRSLLKTKGMVMRAVRCKEKTKRSWTSGQLKHEAEGNGSWSEIGRQGLEFGEPFMSCQGAWALRCQHWRAAGGFKQILDLHLLDHSQAEGAHVSGLLLWFGYDMAGPH